MPFSGLDSLSTQTNSKSRFFPPMVTGRSPAARASSRPMLTPFLMSCPTRAAGPEWGPMTPILIGSAATASVAVEFAASAPTATTPIAHAASQNCLIEFLPKLRSNRYRRCAPPAGFAAAFTATSSARPRERFSTWIICNCEPVSIQVHFTAIYRSKIGPIENAPENRTGCRGVFRRATEGCAMSTPTMPAKEANAKVAPGRFAATACCRSSPREHRVRRSRDLAEVAGDGDARLHAAGLEPVMPSAAARTGRCAG